MGDDTVSEDKQWIKYWLKIAAGVIVFLMLLLVAWKGISPQLNLYRANTEKQARIAESKAKAAAAEYEAEAEVARAKGVAEANEIIAASITDNYLRYLYITGLAESEDKTVIYVPTEGMIPITEAGRATSSEIVVNP